MNKNKIILSALLCLSMLLSGITVLAYTGNPDAIYCDICQSPLNTGSTAKEHGEWTHQVEVEGLSDKNGDPIYQTCHASITVTQVGKTCPAHGVRFNGECHDEYHSSEYCKNHGHSRHYE